MPKPDGALKHSYCRTCHAFCAVEIEVADGRLVRIRGDASDPVSHGFVCSKGLQAPESHHGPGRLMVSQARQACGGYAPITSDVALLEISERLGAIIAAHGPGAVAVYGGTQNLFDAINPLASRAFAASTGAGFYGTMTIDQSAKWVAEARAGSFGGGPQPFAGADVWMLVGSNPLVSMVAAGGPTQFGFHDPIRALKQAKARGLKLIVIDPRLSDTARYADVFLQPYPGEDAALLAGLLHIVLREGWQDEPFCAAHLEPLEGLRAAVRDFAPEQVSTVTGVSEDQLFEAAATFARDGRRGMAGSGTGPDMAADSNLAEHLIQVLNLICGRYLREGEQVSNPGVLTPRRPKKAQAVPGFREWETSVKSSRTGLGTLRGERMTARLADEILDVNEPIRALICVGGNPAVALPDQSKALSALGSLELLVTIDPRMSATARLSHYVLAPLLPYERADQTSFLERFFSVPYAYYTPAIIAPDAASDLVDDWYVFWRIATNLGLPLSFAGFDFPTDRTPTREELLASLAAGAQAPYDAITALSRGRIYDVQPQYVEPRQDSSLRLEMLPPDVAKDLEDLARRKTTAASELASGRPAFRLIVRRQRALMNSTLSDAPAVRTRTPENPIYIHPDDMAALGVAKGEPLSVAISGQQMHGPAEPDNSLRRGVVAMTHGWGPVSNRVEHHFGQELATNLLVDPALGEQAINAMPIMTAIPVHVDKAASLTLKGTRRPAALK